MPKTNKISILSTTDKKYAPYCGVMLSSVFQNNPGSDAYILVDGALTKRDRAKFHQLEQQYDTEIHCIPIAADLFADMPVGWVAKATYYRLMAPSFLPRDIDRILYLDCDIVVNEDLTGLWTIDLSGKSSAVVIESDCYSPEARHFENLGYEKSYGYFNAGMMLINLDFWRKCNVQQQALDYLNKNVHKLDYFDQDVLNFVLKDSKIFVSPTYNFQSYFLERNHFKYLPENIRNQILESKPAIAHILLKPWDIRSYYCPFYSLWHKYLGSSPWHTENEHPLRTKSVRAIVKRYLMWPLGIGIPDIFIDEFKKHPEWH